MRVLPIAAAVISVGLIGTASGVTALAATRQASFAHRAATLERRWSDDVAAGVPAASLAGLRSQLDGSHYHQAAAWAPMWWGDTGAGFLSALEVKTTAVWNAAVDSAREGAGSVLDAWKRVAAQYGQYVPADAMNAARSWPAQLARAGTPITINRLVAIWSGNVTVARDASMLNQLNAQVSSYGGVNGLLAQADSAATRASRERLDPGQVPVLTATLRTQLSSHVDATGTLSSLVTAMQTLRALFTLNANVGGGLRPLLYSVDQAAAEQTPNAKTFLTQYGGIAQAFSAASQSSALNAVAAQIASLQTVVTSELSADQCGHAVPAGRVITLNLTLQEAIFYQDGCVVQATPITTGRPYLRTPTGTFHIFKKASPWLMVSPWPQGSPYWYPAGYVNWVMEFASGGYFLHDASWEPASMYGPGSENTYVASHGCVHIPTSVMQWAYQWTPMNTPVIISN